MGNDTHLNPQGRGGGMLTMPAGQTIGGGSRCVASFPTDRLTGRPAVHVDVDAYMCVTKYST